MAATFLIFGSCSQAGSSSAEKNTLSFDTIPEMEFYTPAGEKFSTLQLKEGKPVVFFFFSPQCPYCKKNTDEMLQNLHRLKEVRLFFVSAEMREEVMAYSREYNLEAYKDITLLLDNNYEFDNKYLPTVTPIYYIYGEDLLYRGTLTGKTTTSEILKMAGKKK